MPFTPYYMYSVAAKNGNPSEIGATILWWLVLSLFFLGLGYFFYRKRPSEAAGHAMAFKISEPIVKIALAVPAALFAAVIFKMLNSNDWLVGFALIFTPVLASCLLQAIFEFDPKAAFNKKLHILISLALSVLIFFLFIFIA
jgi:ABC-2 type transport system permease protein